VNGGRAGERTTVSNPSPPRWRPSIAFDGGPKNAQILGNNGDAGAGNFQRKSLGVGIQVARHMLMFHLS
jgi:hypothetical protein